jgi:SAM-dependent methyltransferase
VNEREYHDLHYEEDAARIHSSALFERLYDRAARQFLRATGAGRNQRLLSLGCGDGSLEVRIAPHVGEIVGLDISAVAIRQAEQRRAAAGFSNVSFRVGDGGRLHADDLGRFDIVAAFAFLHHLGDGEIADTLAAARERLRPGGMFYSSDPSRRRFIGLFTRCVRHTYERYHSPDERELDPDALATLAARAGFARAAIDYVDYFLGPVAWLMPGTPRWLAPPLLALDDLALRVPLVRGYASSFTLLATAA